MMTSDDTKLFGSKNPATSPKGAEPKQAQQSNSKWKTVAVGAGTGILLGTGTLMAANALHADEPDATPTGDIKEAHANDGDSFSDAFNSARAQVGPGGVFEWHGKLYSTYTKEEWDNMSDEEKDAFADSVRPMAQATEAEAHNAQHVEAHAAHQQADPDVHATAMHHTQADADVTPVNGTPNPNSGDDDVHVVGQTTVGGHQTLMFDVDGDSQADVALIDVNDNMQVDDNDVMVDTAGNAMTVGQMRGQAAESAEPDYDTVATSNDSSDPGADAGMDPNTDPAMQTASNDGYDPGADLGLDSSMADDGSGMV